MDRCSRAFKFTIDAVDVGKRLDFLVCAKVPDCSRSLAAELIRAGSVQVDGQIKKSGYRARKGDEVQGLMPEPVMTCFEPEPIELSILYEDPAIIVLNKQPGIVVHPAPGHARGTLVNAILHHCPEVGAIGGELRPGIVHRLDRDTSGVMIVAKNAFAMKRLSEQFKSRQVQKEYLALVRGVVESDCGTISLPIGRHPVDRKRMSTVGRKTRTAETDWQVSSRLTVATLLRVRIRTGRTHQIRVHCAAMHHPVVGDPVYGVRKIAVKFNKALLNGLTEIESVGRQMLHSWRIGFMHPVSNQEMLFEAPMPADMTLVLEALRRLSAPSDLSVEPENRNQK